MAFDYLFERGSSYQAGVLKFFFAFNPPPASLDAPLALAVAVPKRSKGFKRANRRNLMKRRIREAYRLQKSPLYHLLADKSLTLAVLIRFNPPEPVPYKTVQAAMARGLRYLIQEAEKFTVQPSGDIS